MSGEDAGRPVDAYRELFERSADAILIIEGEMFIDCNQAAVEMLRCADREEVLRTHPSELSPPRQPDGRESFEKANAMIAVAFERGSHRFEWMHRRADGEVFPVEVLLTAVQEAERRVLHVVWRDITERTLLEEQLRHTQKLEALGKLTGGIAHDFNNLLVAILGHAELLGLELERQPKARAHAETILRTGRKAAELVRQLLAFGRKQQLLPRVLDLSALIDDLRGLLEPLVGASVHLDVRHVDADVRVKADRGQLEQVVLNLASNARDAMPGGGRLTLEVGRVWSDEVLGHDGQPLPAGEYARLVVSDTGAGMDAETQGRALDPFFTTKQTGKGTGLGLSTAYGIVRQSGGTLRIASSPGQGTTIRVLLPLCGHAPEVPRHVREPRSQGGHETILVAEDEPEVAELVQELLRSAGYRVLAAGDGAAALDLYVATEEPIHLVLTDVIMPRMSGPELIGALLERGERPPALFMSGYTNDALTELYESYQNVRLVEKPFASRELLRRVREALDATDGAPP